MLEVACHRRGEVGGVTSDRSDLFVMTKVFDMGDEGRLPPHLTGVGAKLKLAFPRKLHPAAEGNTPVFGLDLINGHWKTEELWKQHLFGAQSLGIYPVVKLVQGTILGSSAVCRWACSDIDTADSPLAPTSAPSLSASASSSESGPAPSGGAVTRTRTGDFSST